MVLPQRKVREIAFQILYNQQFEDFTEAGVPLLMRQHKLTKKVVRAVVERAELIIQKIPEIDPLIQEKSIDYDLARISSIEKNIIRMGIYELLYDEAIPEKVAISEALRVCKKYGSMDSVAFVNGVLDSVYKGKQCEAASI